MSDVIFSNIKNNILEIIEKKKLNKSIPLILEASVSREIKLSDIRNNIEGIDIFIDKASELFNNRIFFPPRKIDNFNDATEILERYTPINMLGLMYVTSELIENIDEMQLCIIKHNLVTALISRSIAYKLKIKPNSMTLFIIGYYHNFGKMLLYEYEKGVFIEIMENAKHENELFHVIENKIFKKSLHNGLAVHILEKLGYNKKIVEAVKNYYHPAQAGEEYRVYSLILHLADIIARGFNIGEPGDDRIPVFEQRLWSSFSFTKEDLQAIFRYFVPKILDIYKIINLLIK